MVVRWPGGGLIPLIQTELVTYTRVTALQTL